MTSDPVRRGGGHVTPDGVSLRPAAAADAGAIGRLHADSWRRHYRGSYPDEYLDGDLEGERVGFWTRRLAEAGQHWTIVAEKGGELVGFAHLRLDEDARWGALLDNLHVRHMEKGRGVGTALMAEVGRIVVERRPGSGLWLWVLQANTAAQAFYGARGGVCVEEGAGPERGGVTAAVLRIAWRDPALLLPAA